MGMFCDRADLAEDVSFEVQQGIRHDLVVMGSLLSFE